MVSRQVEVPFVDPVSRSPAATSWPKDEYPGVSDGWRRFAPVVEGRVDVAVPTGPDRRRAVRLEVPTGRAGPRTGHVVQL